MKYRPRIHYTETDKALMWDRWHKGESFAVDCAVVWPQSLVGRRCIVSNGRHTPATADSLEVPTLVRRT